MGSQTFFKKQVGFLKKMSLAAQLPRTSGLFKKKSNFREKCSGPGSAAAPDKWFVQKKSDFGEQVLPQAAQLPGTSGLFKTRSDF